MINVCGNISIKRHFQIFQKKKKKRKQQQKKQKKQTKKQQQKTTTKKQQQQKTKTTTQKNNNNTTQTKTQNKRNVEMFHIFKNGQSTFFDNNQKYRSVFRENRCPLPPKRVYVAISVMKLCPWKLGQGQQNLISYWSYPIYIGLQIWQDSIQWSMR